MYLDEKRALDRPVGMHIFSLKGQIAPLILTWVPFLFLSTVAASISYIGISTVYQCVTGLSFRSGFLFLCLILFNAWVLKPYCRGLLNTANTSLRTSQLPLLLGALCLILYRSSFYFHALDDFVFHMVAGFFFDRLWCEFNFMPLSWGSYHLPLLQVIYSFSLENFGIRLTLLLLSLIQLSWFLSLNSRVSCLMYPTQPDKRWIVDSIFAFFYFLPELMLTHGTFMSDGYTMLFALETAYAFISGGGFGLLCVLIAGVIMTKQSALLFAPFVVYILASRAKTCTWSDVKLVLPFSIAVGIFLAACYYYTGNPLSYLLNGYFKAPLYEAGNFRDARWGPVGWPAILVWPLFGSFSERYVEFNSSTLLKPFFSIILVLPFIWSLLILLIGRRFIGLVSLGALLFWSHQSGYGRYHLSITAVIWIFMLLSIKDVVPSIRTTSLRLLVPLLLVAVGLVNFSRDYALRRSPILSIFPPRLDPYTSRLVLDGMSLLGIDTPRNIYGRINDNTGQYDAVAINGRGVSTLYGFLISYYRNIPLIQVGSDSEHERVLNSSSVSPHIKISLGRLAQFRKILLIVDKEQDEQLRQVVLKSKLLSGFDCSQTGTPILVPEFPHENYFGYVIQRSCENKVVTSLTTAGVQ